MSPTVGDINHALYVAPTDSPETSREHEDFAGALNRVGIELDCERIGASTPHMSIGKDNFEESLSYLSKYDLVIANINQPSEYIGQRVQVSNSLGRLLVATFSPSTAPSRMVLGASHLRLTNSSRDNAASLVNYLKENSKHPLPISAKLHQLDLSEVQNADPLEFALQKAKPIAYVAFPITNVPEASKQKIRAFVRRIGSLLHDLGIDVRDLEHKLTDPNTPRGRNASSPNIYQSNQAEIARADFVILLTSDQISSTGVGMEHAMASFGGKPQIHVGALNDRSASILPTRLVSQHIDNKDDDENFAQLAELLRDYRAPFVTPARYKFAGILDRIFDGSGPSHRQIGRKMELKYGEPIKGFSVSNISKLRNPDAYATNLPSQVSIAQFCEILYELHVDAELVKELNNFRT
ncbi:MAG: hypothetical protein KF716_20920 [Anaerolineae bacterium]|nr:hypothetical protein [Anaerolineae bacterium]